MLPAISEVVKEINIDNGFVRCICWKDCGNSALFCSDCFPEYFEAFLNTSIIGRAVKEAKIEVEIVNLRITPRTDMAK